MRVPNAGQGHKETREDFGFGGIDLSGLPDQDAPEPERPEAASPPTVHTEPEDFGFEGVDLSGLPDQEPEPQDQLMKTVKAAAGVNPDDAAKAIAYYYMRGQQGPNPGQITGSPELMKQARSMPPSSLSAKDSPLTIEWAISPRNYAVAYDDWEALAKLERRARRAVKQGGQHIPPDVARRAEIIAQAKAGEFDDMAQEPSYGSPLATGPQFGVVAQKPGLAEELAGSAVAGPARVTGGLADYLGGVTGSEYLREAANDMNMFADYVDVDPEDRTIWHDLAGAGGSMLPLVLGSILTGGGLAAAGAPAWAVSLFGASAPVVLESMSEGGQVMRQVREQGGSEYDAVKAGVGASLAQLPANAAFNMFGGKISKSLARRLLTNAGKEGTQEALQGVISDLAVQYGVNEGQITLGQVFEALDPSNRAYEFLVGGIVGGGFGAILEGGEIKPSQVAQRLEAAIDGPVAAKMLGEAAASKLNGRSPEKFQEFVGKIVEGGIMPRQLYIKARDIVTLFQEASKGGAVDPLDLPEVLEAAGLDPDEFEQAVGLDETITMDTAKVGDFVAKFPGAETLFQSGPDAPDAVDATIKELAADYAKPPLKAMEEFARQAIAAGERPEVAQAAAELAGAMARMWGIYTGSDPAEFMQRLSVIGPEGLAPPRGGRFGKAQRLFIQAQRSRVARFELREAGELIASHDPATFAPRAEYPAGIQERDYQGEVAEQAKVRTNAQMGKPEYFINTNPDAINGPPVITPDGITLGGNSRVMSLILAYGEDGGKAGAKYKQMLESRAREFGLDPDQVRAMQQPVLVRTIEQANADSKAMHRLVSALNAPPTQAMSEEAEAVSRGKNTSAETLAMIAGLLERQGNTIRALLDEAKTARKILNALERDGVIKKTEGNKYWSNEHKRITSQGKNLVESAVLGAVLPSVDLLRVAPPWVRQNLAKNLDHLAKLKARGGAWDLTPDLAQAVELVLRAEVSPGPVEQLKQYLAQQNLPGMEQDFSPKAQAIALHMVENRPTELRAKLKAHAADAAADVPGQASLVPLLSPMESFIEHFGQVESLGQPMNPDVDPNRRVPIVEPTVVFSVKELPLKGHRRRELIKRVAKAVGADGKVTIKDTGWAVGLSRNNIKHAISSAHNSPVDARVGLEAVANLPRLIENAVLVESHADTKNEKGLKQVHRLFAAFGHGDGEVYAAKITVKEFEETTQTYLEGVYSAYDAKLESKVPGGTHAPKQSQGTEATHSTPSTDISLGHLLAGVKDRNGKPYLSGVDGETYYQSAYHGSPHRFDAFSLAHIGAGEGAQAYGYGLYFASKREVAEWYREKLSDDTAVTIDGERFIETNNGWAREEDGYVLGEDSSDRPLEIAVQAVMATGDSFDAKELIQKWTEEAEAEGGEISHGYDVYSLDELQAAKDAIDDFDIEPATLGQLYKVDLPGDEVMLDWDKALNEQPEAVKDALAKVGIVYDKESGDKFNDALAAALTEDGPTSLPKQPQNPSGDEIYRMLRNQFGTQRAASSRLDSLGIKGIKYLDGSSRGRGEGSHNYVIFDDKAVEVLETYYQQKRGAVHFTPGGQAIIQLMKYGDASTLVHELGHIARRTLAEMARRPDASERMRADYRAMCEFVGAEPGGMVWTTEQEEKLAQAFEQYVMEGQAPAPRLRAAFERFRRWMLDVYRRFAGNRYEINDQIRGVFDRMLALDSEIAMARAEAELHPLLRPEDIPLSERQGYADLAEAARAAAAQQVMDHRLKDYKKHLALWRKEGKAIADADPGHLLLDGLAMRGGISRESLEIIADKNTANAVARKRVGLVRKEGGEDFLALAFEQNGITPVELLERITATPTKAAIIDGYVRRKTAEYEAEAQPFELAVSAEMEAMLAKEAELLAKKAGASLVRPFREVWQAEDVSIADLEAMNYPDMQADYRRVAKLAVDAYKGGRLEEAARHKATQAAKARKLRQAGAARREIAKNKRYLKRVARTQETPLEQSGGIAEQWLQQIRGLVGRIMDLPMKAQARRDTPSLNEYINSLPEEDRPPIDADLINQSGQWDIGRIMQTASRKKDGTARAVPLSPLGALTRAQLKELTEAVMVLEHMGKAEKKYIAFEKQMEMGQAVAETVEAVREGTGTEPPDEVDQVLVGEAPHEASKRSAGDIKSMLDIPEFIIRRLDGFKDLGRVWDLVFRPINEASNQSLGMMKAAGEDIKALYELVPKDLRQDWGKRRKIEGLPQMLTGTECVCAALNVGNEQNREALMMGYGWDETQLEAVKDTLKKEEWQFVQGVWDFIDSFYPSVDATHYQLFGRRMVKVQAEAVQTKFGELRGGYYPLQFDRRKSRTIERFAQRETDLDAREHEFQIPWVRRGFTIKRQGGKYPILLDLSVLAGHVSGAIHFTTHAQVVRSVHRLMKDDFVAAAIRQGVGEARYNRLMTWLVAVARPERVLSGAAESWLKAANDNYVVAALAYNLMTAVKQPLAITQGMARVGVRNVLRAVTEMTPSTIRAIQQKSVYMLNRSKTLDRDLSKAIKQGWGGPGQKGHQVMREWGFKHIGLLDTVTCYPVWQAAYNQGLQRFQGNEAKAVDYADMQVRNTQGSGLVKDQAQVLRGGEMWRMSTMFYTFFSSAYNLIHEETSIWSANKGEVEAWLRYGRSLMLLWIIPSIAEGFLNRREEWEPVDALKDMAGFPLACLPLVRELTGGYRYGGGPVGEVVNAVADLGRTNKPDKVIEKSIRILGSLPLQKWSLPRLDLRGYAGLPVNQITTTMRGALGIAEGEYDGPEGLAFLLIRDKKE